MFLRDLKAVIFDLDGTLIDSVPEVSKVLTQLCRRHNVPLPSAKLMRYWSSYGGTRMIKEVMNCDAKASMLYLEEFRSIYLKLKVNPDQAFPGGRELLKKLQSMGIKLALCTNKPEALSVKILDELKMLDFFEITIFGDTLAVRKPHPSMLQCIIQGFNLDPSQAVLVGDSSVDQETAQACQMDFWFFDSGYDPSVRRDLAARQIRAFSELIDELR